MPEGDTILSAARLEGRGVRSVDTRGKHMFVRFDGDLTLHSHLRMGGPP
jgi:endonuclease-8